MSDNKLSDAERIELIEKRLEKWHQHLEVLTRMMEHDVTTSSTHAQRNGTMQLFREELKWLQRDLRYTLHKPMISSEVDDIPF